MIKVGIVYGFGEGKGNSRLLRQALRQSDFQIVRNLSDADIILAHSAGGLSLPPIMHAKLVVMVGLPYWPDKNLLRSLREKLRTELTAKEKGWPVKNAWHTFYILTKPRYLMKLWRAWKRAHYPLPEAPLFVLIRNEQDPFLHPTEFLTLGEEMGWKVASLPGQHDDLWLHPEPYVKLIKKYYGLLEKTDR